MIPRATDSYPYHLFQQYSDPSNKPVNDATSTQAGSTDSKYKNYEYDNHDNGYINAEEGEAEAIHIDPPKKEIGNSTENIYSQYKDYVKTMSWEHFS